MLKHVIIHNVCIISSVCIILLVDHSTRWSILNMTQQLSINVFGFRCTGIKAIYVAAIAAIGKHLQKNFLY